MGILIVVLLIICAIDLALLDSRLEESITDPAVAHPAVRPRLAPAKTGAYGLPSGPRRSLNIVSAPDRNRAMAADVTACSAYARALGSRGGSTRMTVRAGERGGCDLGELCCYIIPTSVN